MRAAPGGGQSRQLSPTESCAGRSRQEHIAGRVGEGATEGEPRQGHVKPRASRAADAIGLLRSPVPGVFEDKRTSPAPPLDSPPEPPPPEPPPEPPPNGRRPTKALSSQAIIAVAKKFGWRCKWQPGNIKQSGSLSETGNSSY